TCCCLASSTWASPTSRASATAAWRPWQRRCRVWSELPSGRLRYTSVALGCALALGCGNGHVDGPATSGAAGTGGGTAGTSGTAGSGTTSGAAGQTSTGAAGDAAGQSGTGTAGQTASGAAGAGTGTGAA